MSVVVAIKDKDGSWVLGGESQTTNNWLKFYRNKGEISEGNRENSVYSKVVDIRGCVGGVLGSVGNVRLEQKIQCMDNLIPTEVQEDTSKFYRYLVNSLVPRIIEQKKEDNFTRTEFIIAYKDKAFCISEFNEVLPLNDYYAIGQSDLALGALYSINYFTNSDLSPIKLMSAKSKVGLALDACCKYSIYCSGEYIFKDTKESLK